MVLMHFKKVTIKMQSASADDIVGGLYGAYTALSQDVPEGTTPVDYMWTTRAASRTSHKYTSNGGNGTFRNRTWLDGSGTTGQTWTMKVNKTNRNYLMLLLWGDESDVRNFDIMCDDVLIASESLCHNDPGRFMMRCYPIPEEGTSGKETVKIHLTSPTGTKTGGIFYAYMLSIKEDATVILTPSNSTLQREDTVYNLQGIRLPEPKPGICIINGVKMLIR